MRADRLVSLVLLLRQRGRMTAEALAQELEVSTRTVLRDIEALSTAGVPVYAERGRYGGYALLPGFRTELTGLNHDEAVALLAVGSGREGKTFGLGPALASAMRKVFDALPESQRAAAGTATSRLLLEPRTDLLSRPVAPPEISDDAMTEVRRAVLGGHRLRISYAAAGEQPRWRVVDPVGLVAVRDTGYLVAVRDGADRTYRLSRIHAAEALTEPAYRPAQVDLDRVWQHRCAQFLSENHLGVTVRVRDTVREQILGVAEGVRSESREPGGWLRLDVAFQDHRHAVWAIWQLGPDAEVIGPPGLREALRERAALVADRYRDAGPGLADDHAPDVGRPGS
ncbi:YafY family protein [Blastococcus sp. Marseille-P5729]|uniref:helix-turn-helix transcriptional regulator n=1 Tax=Blastococcus sp. Marseille-P5729 TaxID=2086582 RepID=UPI000D0F47BA|nr:WYL domain-containing protein [Blastococcus sp. Marseille-P5729]